MDFGLPRGINFDNSISFTSKGQEYLLAIMLGVPQKGKYMTHVVDASMLSKLEFVGEANNLCMSGTLVVVDTNGTIGNFYDSSPCLIGVAISRKTNAASSKNDGDFSSSSGSSSGEFQHTFMADKISVLDRQQNAVIYEFKFRSTMWTRLISSPRYSNIDKQDEEIKIFDIMKEILGTAFEGFKLLDDKEVSIDGESFEKIYSSDPPILKNYITYANDTVFDVLRFLQSRLYFSGEDNFMASPGISYLNFDWLTGKIGVVDFDGESVLPKYLDGTTVALDGKTFEQLISGKEQGFSSYSKLGFFPFVMNFFGYDIFNQKTNFGKVITEVNSKQISDFFNQKALKFEDSVKFDANELEEFLFGDNGMFPKKLAYKQEYSTSTLNDETFHDLLRSILDRDVLVFETVGNISHMPGMIYTIAGKTRHEGGGDSSGSAANTNILGVFHIVKAVHTITPMSKDDGGKYREKLYLAKTWTKKS